MPRLVVTRQEVVHPGRSGESSGCQVITHPDQEAWMNIHKNARLTPYRRQELVARVERGEPVTAVARAFGVSRQTARKWVVRKRDAGVVDSTAWAGDGSSRPDHSPRQTEPKIQLAIKVLRWQRWTCRQIAGALAIDTSTAARILRRVGLSRRPRLEPPATVQRYEHAAVGDLLHLDMKKLGRITSVGRSVRGFVRRARRVVSGARGAHPARAHRQRLGLSVAGLRATCRALHLAHRRTRPYTPRTNGTAERPIQTLLREWAYIRPYYTSADRTRVLPGWLEHYNCARPHASLGKRPPMSRFQAVTTSCELTASARPHARGTPAPRGRLLRAHRRRAERDVAARQRCAPADRARAPPGRPQPRRQRGSGRGADGRPRAHPPDPPLRGRRGRSPRRDPLDRPREGALPGGPRSCRLLGRGLALVRPQGPAGVPSPMSRKSESRKLEANLKQHPQLPQHEHREPARALT